MTAGFEEARTLQRRAIWAGAIILLPAALGSAVARAGSSPGASPAPCSR